MARKSQALRLSQINDLVSAFDSAGLMHDRSYCFMQDMIRKMELGKYPTAGQRKYLDSLINQGVPKPKNEQRVKEILVAADVDGMQQVKQTLQDFAYKVGKGWNLSEKQDKFLTNLMAKADTLSVEGRFRPSGEIIKDLENAVAICQIKNSWYWQHRPGTAKAYDRISQWVMWNTRREVIDNVFAELGRESIHEQGEEPIIDQWVCDKLLSAVKNQINELKNPKYLEGSMVWRIMSNVPRMCVLITGCPTIKRGIIVYPCLVGGEALAVPSEDLRKRRR